MEEKILQKALLGDIARLNGFNLDDVLDDRAKQLFILKSLKMSKALDLQAFEKVLA